MNGNSVKQPGEEPTPLGSWRDKWLDPERQAAVFELVKRGPSAERDEAVRALREPISSGPFEGINVLCWLCSNSVTRPEILPLLRALPTSLLEEMLGALGELVTRDLYKNRSALLELCIAADSRSDTLDFLSTLSPELFKVLRAALCALLPNGPDRNISPLFVLCVNEISCNAVINLLENQQLLQDSDVWNALCASRLAEGHYTALYGLCIKGDDRVRVLSLLELLPQCLLEKALLALCAPWTDVPFVNMSTLHCLCADIAPAVRGRVLNLLERQLLFKPLPGLIKALCLVLPLELPWYEPPNPNGNACPLLWLCADPFFRTRVLCWLENILLWERDLVLPALCAPLKRAPIDETSDKSAFYWLLSSAGVPSEDVPIQFDKALTLLTTALLASTKVEEVEQILKAIAMCDDPALPQHLNVLLDSKKLDPVLRKSWRGFDELLSKLRLTSEEAQRVDWCLWALNERKNRLFFKRPQKRIGHVLLPNQEKMALCFLLCCRSSETLLPQLLHELLDDNGSGVFAFCRIGHFRGGELRQLGPATPVENSEIFAEISELSAQQFSI